MRATFCLLFWILVVTVMECAKKYLGAEPIPSVSENIGLGVVLVCGLCVATLQDIRELLLFRG